MTDHPDRPRLQRLLDDYFEHMRTECEGLGIEPTELSVDEAMLVTAVTYRDADGDQSEQIAMVSTSTRRFVQLGLLAAGHARQEKAMGFTEVEDDGDHD